jgi:hypothetical protein
MERSFIERARIIMPNKAKFEELFKKGLAWISSWWTVKTKKGFICVADDLYFSWRGEKWQRKASLIFLGRLLW